MKNITKEIIEKGEIKVPQYLTRKFLHSGGTNPDYVSDLCTSIVDESKKEMWDVDYLLQKIHTLNEFVRYEQKRLEAHQKYQKEIKAEAQKICTVCGKPNHKDNKLCRICGARL